MPQRLLLALLVVTASALSQETSTLQLTADLRAVRGNLWLPSEAYRPLRDRYIGWIDSRLRAGRSVESLNRELRTAGLFPKWPNSSNVDALADEMDQSHAGYLEPIFAKGPLTARGIVVFGAGLYRGAGCSLDVTALVYQRRPWKRLAVLNAGDPDYAFYLSGADAGTPDRSGNRIVATGWVASNCTSTWNGKRIRIDRIQDSSVVAVLARNLNAQDRDRGENVAAKVRGDGVTFTYRGATGDGDLISGPAIARYRVVKDRPVRLAPIALTRAGFLYEWLNMENDEAENWASAEAFAARSSLPKHGFEWKRIARCGGSPVVWEVGVQTPEPERLHVFRIQGERATELRMVGVGESPTGSCAEEGLTKGLRGLAAELPW